MAYTRSDASGTCAWAIIYERLTLWGRVSKVIQNWSIQVLELLPVLRLLQYHGESARGKLLAITTDNVSNIYAINRGKGKGKVLEILREIYRLCDVFDIDIVAFWLPRETNVTSDTLSKTLSSDLARRYASNHGLHLIEVPHGTPIRLSEEEANRLIN
jgi:hypothetical protein